MTRLVLLASVMLCFVLCQTQPRTMVMYGSGDLGLKGISHINTDTGISHNFGITSSKVIHRTYTNKFGNINVLANVAGASHIDAVHVKHNATGAYGNDGDQIVVFIFSARRSGKADRKCNDEIRTGCKEIYIVESYDDGVTWGEPIFVNRTDMNDMNHRHAPSMAYDREQGIIYIVYAVTPRKGNSYIGMVTKKVGESKYSNEVALKLNNQYSWAQPKVTVTNPEKAKGIAHLSILGGSNSNESSVYYTRSLDNGVTWAETKDFTPNEHNASHYNGLSATGVTGSKDVYLIYTSNKLSRLSISLDNGESWLSPMTVTENGGIVPYVKACGKARTLGALMSIFQEENFSVYSFYYYNATSETIGKFVTPFKDLKTTLHIPMFDCTGLTEESLSYTAVAGFGNTIVFAQYNYKYPQKNQNTK